MSSNEELVEKIRSGENVEKNVEELYLQNEALIGKIASQYMGYCEVEDLKQEGYFGLVTALELWSPDGGASFSTYAFHWIRQTMRRYVDNCGTLVRLPSRTIDRIYKYKKAVESFNQSFMRSPTSRELALYMGISPSEVETVKRDAQLLNPRSIEETIGEDDSLTLGDTISDERDEIEDALDRVQRDELSSFLWSLVGDLQNREAEILRKRYKEGLSLKACGENLGVSTERARQIEQKALRKMRKEPVRKQLEPYLEDGALSIAYNSTGLGTFRRTWTSAPERTVMYIERYQKQTPRSLEN